MSQHESAASDHDDHGDSVFEMPIVFEISIKAKHFLSHVVT